MTADTLFADRYRLERRLGTGGMATVQLALDTRLERYVAVKLLADHLAQDANFAAALPARGARRRAARAPEHRPGLRLRRGGVDRAASSSSWSSSTGRAARRSCSELGRLDARRRRLDPHPGLPRARLRAPQRRRAPRRQAGQPAAQPRRRPGQARRLRHRQGGRAVRHHEGRLRARHGRLPLARAGARRVRRPAPPTSTRSASSPTSCSPAGCPTRRRR